MVPFMGPLSYNKSAHTGVTSRLRTTAPKSNKNLLFTITPHLVKVILKNFDFRSRVNMGVLPQYGVCFSVKP
jgi:hypothetical protein